MKNRKALHLLLAANAVSQFAQGISMLAIPWYFASQLGQTSTFAVIYAFATFITLFWGLYAGTLIDRFSRKRIFLSLCAVSFVVLSGVASSGFILGQVPTFLVALVFCFTLFNYNIHYPTLYAFGQEITEKAYYGKTNSLLEVMGQSVNVISGAFAVILLEGLDKTFLGMHFYIEAWEIHEIFLMDAMTYLFAFSVIRLIKYAPVERKTIHRGSVWERLKMGMQYLKKRPILFYFGNASFTVFIFVLLSTHLLWPIYIQDFLEAKGGTYATTKMFYALGALTAGFFITRWFRNAGPIRGIIILMLIAFLAFISHTVIKEHSILFGLALLIGISNAGIRIQRITYLFNHIPNHIIGRTNSVFQSINIFLRSVFIGLFSLAFFSEDNHILWAFAIAALAIVVSLIPFFKYYQRLRNLKLEDAD